MKRSLLGLAWSAPIAAAVGIRRWGSTLTRTFDANRGGTVGLPKRLAQTITLVFVTMVAPPALVQELFGEPSGTAVLGEQKGSTIPLLPGAEGLRWTTMRG